MKQRRWYYLEPHPGGRREPVRVEVTEEQILQDYFPYWCSRMTDAGKEHLISVARCIDDFVGVHWATEIKEP